MDCFFTLEGTTYCSMKIAVDPHIKRMYQARTGSTLLDELQGLVAAIPALTNVHIKQSTVRFGMPEVRGGPEYTMVNDRLSGPLGPAIRRWQHSTERSTLQAVVLKQLGKADFRLAAVAHHAARYGAAAALDAVRLEAEWR